MIRSDSDRTAHLGRRWPAGKLAVVLCIAALPNTVWSNPVRSQSPYGLATAFSFDGTLQHGGAPAEGRHDFRFELYDRPTGGEALGAVERPGVDVTTGRFDVWLDFGLDVFALDAAFVGIAVRPSGDVGAPQPLEPRQRLGGGGTCIVNQPVTVAGAVTVDSPPGETDVSTACCNPVADGGQVQLEGFASDLRLTSGEIQAMTFGVPGQLRLNAAGGTVGIGVAAAPGGLSLPAGPDSSPGGGGALVVGPTSGTNLAFDGNEIMARSNGAPSTLHLNADGSDVRIGGDLDIAIERVVVTEPSLAFVGAACPAPKKLVSGGCSAAGTGVVTVSRRFDSETWYCEFTDGSPPYVAYALCARIRWQ